jgi:esterase/lipase
MPMIPAFCDNCGFAFSSGIFVENCLNITLSGNKAGPCPKCGSMGSVIDGIFNASRNVIEIVSAPFWTYEKLQSLSKILSEIRDSEETPEQKTERIKKEAPELSSIADSLPKTRMELYAFITMFLAIITVLLSQCAPQDSSDEKFEKTELQYVLNTAVDEIQKG